MRTPASRVAPVPSLDATPGSQEGGNPAPESSRPRAAPYLSPGQQLADRYEVLAVEGEGGMGVVYRCRDHHGELVAVKRVVLPVANAEEHLGWFLAEAQALAGLNHENIVRARDFGQLRDGTPYLAMDLVEGVSLQHVTAAPVSFALLWLVTDQVLAALAHAHARGVVHGDLKPSNVIVGTDERGLPRARLFDFGLAKRCRIQLDPRLGQWSAPSHPPPSAGTPGYMAPEQILGRRSEIGSATDLYGLGSILYRALCGRTPLGRKPGGEVDFQCFRELERPRPPPDVPEAAVDLVMRLLRKRPWERVSSAAEVRAEWRDFSATERDGEAALGLPPVAVAERTRSLVSVEITRRIGPPPSPASALRLRRSSRWLPGLLSLRPSPLVGRAALCLELTERFHALATALEPAQHAIVLTGPGGVGKSRLADWLCTDVEERGVALALRGYRASSPSTRDGLAIALSDRFNLGSSALRMAPSALIDRCAPADLGTVVNFILRSADPPNDHAGGSVPHADASGMLRVLVELAGARPVVLWLDDPTHVRPETLALLAALPRHAPRLGVLIVTTARPETLASPAAARTLGVLRAAMTTHFLAVPPLDAQTTSALLRAAFPIDPALALQIAIDSRGIPLDALARLHALAKRGRASLRATG